MKIEETRDYPYPNQYSLRPVVRVRLDLEEMEEYPTSRLDGFRQRLLRVVPSLTEHTCSRGYPGGFVERLEEGTYMGHVIEHVAIELQHQIGDRVVFGCTRGTGRRGVYDVVVACLCCQVGIEAVRLALRLVESILKGEEPSWEEMLRALREVRNRYALGPSAQAIVNAAKARNIPVIRLSEQTSLLQLGYGKYRRMVQATITDQTPAVAVEIACDKCMTKEILRQNQIPTPHGGIAGTEEEAVALAAHLGGMVVVKPYNANQGKGVSMGLTWPPEIRAAFRIAREFSPQVLVEQYIRGRDYRLLVVNGKLAAAAERIPAKVTGDGLHTIRQLVEMMNRDPRRGEDHELPLTRLKIDPIVVMLLARQGVTPDTILDRGREAILRENGNLSTGGTPVDVTELVHPRNTELAVRAAEAIGLDVAGVDVVTPDISVPLDRNGGAVIEVNASPGLRMHLFPAAGKPRDVGGAIVEELFPPGSQARIPIVSITGTNGKTTTTRMIGRMMRQAGLRVGMATSDGIYLNEKRIVTGDTTGPWSAQTILRNSEVEAAVLETARGGIARGGLGYDRCRVAVVTNVTEDHLGQDGVDDLEDLAHLKSLVVECIEPGGAAVLNADDPLVRDMAERTSAEVIYFTARPESSIIRAHLNRGGRVVALEDGILVCRRGNDRVHVSGISEIPAALGGAAFHNVLNAMAAVGAAWGLGVALVHVRAALTSFTCDPECNPGRLNIVELGPVKVVVDYGHNPAGMEAMGQTLVQLGGRRIIGVIAAPGDRRDETITAVGRKAGGIFDLLYIKEDHDLRGRKPGEVAALLRLGALEAGMPPEHIQLILNERQALRAAVTRAEPGDIVAVFYEKYEPVMEEIAVLQARFNHPALAEGDLAVMAGQPTG